MKRKDEPDDSLRKLPPWCVFSALGRKLFGGLFQPPFEELYRLRGLILGTVRKNPYTGTGSS